MSPKNSLLATGLTAMGLFGFAPFGAADPAAVPSGPAAPVAPAPLRSVLLLTSGKIVQGQFHEDAASYVLHRGGGRIPYPKSQVEKAFRTLEEAYQYQVARMPEPERDPDEHMKLARWCMTNHLPAAAKEQLQAVLTLSPNHQQAREMLGKIEGSEDRAMFRDAAIVRTRAEVVTDRGERPDPIALGRAARDLGVSNLPEIPGLPADLSVRRANEFTRGAHTVLQMYCAKCHGEQYAGSFRLVNWKAKHDRTPDSLRANLDATLRLIDWDDPAKSELLSSTLRPHGTGSNKRPIFVGSNDRAYRILAAWVNSLRPPRTRGAIAASRFGNPESSGEEGFATDRPGSVPLPLTPTPASTVPYGARPQQPAVTDPAIPLPPGQFLSGSGAGMQPYAPPNAEFPAPYLVGGPKPKPVSSASASLADPSRTDGAPSRSEPPDLGLPPLPAGAPPPPAKPTSQVAAKPKSRPVKIDPDLLQKTLMNRYGTP